MWHSDEEEDELFLVVGAMVMELRDRSIFRSETSEMLVVPRGVEHRSVRLRTLGGARTHRQYRRCGDPRALRELLSV